MADETTGTTGADTAAADKTQEQTNTQKTFTQDDIDSAISKRLTRERAKWEKEYTEKLEQEKAKANMPELDRLKTEKTELETKLKAAADAVNTRLIKAEVKAQAAALGIKPERIPYLLKLADLSSIPIQEDGEVNAKAVKAELEKVLKAIPEFTAGGGSKVGADFTGNGTQETSNMNFLIRRKAGIL